MSKMSSNIAVVTDHLKAEKGDNTDVLVRSARLDDIVHIDQLAQQEHFDLGLVNMQLYYEISPHSWFVATNKDGKVIGYDCYNDLGEGIYWGFQILIDSDYRGKGVTRAIFKHLGGFLKQSSNSTHLSLKRYPFKYYEFLIHGYWGVVPKVIPQITVPTGYKLVGIDESILPEVIQYDKTILKHFDRAKFLSKWLCSTEPNRVRSLAVVDLSTGDVCGYGAIRLCSDFYQLSTTYADKPELGMALLTNLAAKLKSNEYLFIEIIGSNQTAERFAHNLGLLKTSSEVRVYSMSAEQFDKRFKGQIPEDKVFALHDYWPA